MSPDETVMREALASVLNAEVFVVGKDVFRPLYETTEPDPAGNRTPRINGVPVICAASDSGAFPAMIELHSRDWYQGRAMATIRMVRS